MSFAQLLDAVAVRPDTTVRYPLDRLRIGHADAPVLILKHAGESNLAYRDAMQKFGEANRHRGLRGAAAITLMRVGEAKIWADAVVAGWENVCEEPGKPTPCTPVKVEEFLLELQKSRLQIWKAMCAFAENEDNFAEYPSGTAGALGNG